MPKDVQARFGRKVVTKSLGVDDELAATASAVAIVQGLSAHWDALRSSEGISPAAEFSPAPTTSSAPSHMLRQEIVRTTYEQVLSKTSSARAAAYAQDPERYEGELETRVADHRRLSREVQFNYLDRFIEPTARLLARRDAAVDQSSDWFRDIVRDVAIATLDARDVSNRLDQGEVEPQPTSSIVVEAIHGRSSQAGSSNLAFSVLTERFMASWIANRASDKQTNTEQQKRATLRLFGGYFEDRPIRYVTDADAANFADTLRTLDSHWARSPGAARLPWAQLVERYGGRSRGLSDGTMNRHLQVLQEAWTWAKKRGHCTGENPFDGFHKKLRAGTNVKPYVAWELDELRTLWSSPPKRQDLIEVMIVGMFTAMRLDEVASLTWGQVRIVKEADISIAYFQVEDAKTTAGNRMIPVHSELDWLLRRARGSDHDRLWPTFNKEGPGKKPGADAGREFSRFKAGRGFNDRTKAFHSFRKNVTRMMERAGIPENDWAQIFGHERGFTYRTYNPDGIDMRRRAEIIALIDYPSLNIPHPFS